MKKFLLPLALMSALLVSCEKPENNKPEPEYSISISPAELTFGAEGGEQTVTVTSSEVWYLDEESDWYWVSSSSGVSGAEISIKVSPNVDTENSRSVKLVFTCVDKTAELTINQQKDEIIEFKDPAFLQAILRYENTDRNGDKKISKAEAALIDKLHVGATNVEYPRIRVMDEIKYFTALTGLFCYDNQLTSLDLSNNTALTSLSCEGNQLTSLDVSKNTALTSFSCEGNQLTSLDLSNNTALTVLNCSGNQLTSLDLHNNRLLELLWCENNPLQKLILYKYHIIKDGYIEFIESKYGDIIEYME